MPYRDPQLELARLKRKDIRRKRYERRMLRINPDWGAATRGGYFLLPFEGGYPRVTITVTEHGIERTIS